MSIVTTGPAIATSYVAVYQDTAVRRAVATGRVRKASDCTAVPIAV